MIATDLSEDALSVARRNASRHNVSDQIQFLPGDLLLPLSPLGMDEKLDCVLSNPPYVAERDLPALQREVRDWEPRMALVAGFTGLEVYRRLLPQALRFLKPGGTLILEIGYNMQPEIAELFDAAWKLEGIRDDFSGIPRIVRCSETLGIGRARLPPSLSGLRAWAGWLGRSLALPRARKSRSLESSWHARQTKAVVENHYNMSPHCKHQPSVR